MFRVRQECLSDEDEIRIVTKLAFAKAEHRSGSEGAIVDALRRAKALSLSLVAEDRGQIVGHVAFSPVTVHGVDYGWLGMGPVSVLPDLQSQGIGSSLIKSGLTEIQRQGARGCVVMGAPTYYKRFGFRRDPRLRYPGVPAEYFMALPFSDEVPSGDVAYHAAFGS